MTTYYPEYYKSFRCIADKCRHSCCIGWEIDIDEQTLEKYNKAAGAFGDRLRASVALEGGIAHFALTRGERCPHLSLDGLCDIITACTEDFLCHVCKNHPRFYNVFSTRREIGIGAACEEAARLILSCKESVDMISEHGEQDMLDLCGLTEAEKNILASRAVVLAAIADRTYTVDERMDTVARMFSVGYKERPISEWQSFYKELEILDDEWRAELSLLRNLADSEAVPSAAELPLEQLAAYLAFRHLSPAEDAADFEARLGFVLISYRLLRAIVIEKAKRRGEFLLTDMIDTVRLYSAEIEYNEANTEIIIGEFDKSYEF